MPHVMLLDVGWLVLGAQMFLGATLDGSPFLLASYFALPSPMYVWILVPGDLLGSWDNVGLGDPASGSDHTEKGDH